MAYTPISQTKKTGGYVPIGTKTQPQKSLQEFFPVKQRVGDLSSPSYTPINVPQTKAQAIDKVSEDKVRGVSLSQGKTEKLSPLGKVVSLLPDAISEPIMGAATGLRKMVAPTRSEQMVKATEEDPTRTTEQLIERANELDKDALVLLGKDPYKDRTPVGFVDGGVSGSIKNFIKSLAKETSESVIRQSLKGVVKSSDQKFVDDLVKKIASTSSEEEVSLMIKSAVKTTNPLPKLPDTTPVKSVATKIDNVPTPTAPIRSVVDDVAQVVAKTTDEPAIRRALTEAIPDINATGELEPLVRLLAKKTDAREAKSVIDSLVQRVEKNNLDIGEKKYSSTFEPTPTPEQKPVFFESTNGNVQWVATNRAQAEEFASDPSKIEAGLVRLDEFIPDPNPTKADVGIGTITPEVALRVVKENRLPKKLPTLPKLSPEITQRLQTQQADTTVNRAVLDRYKNLARKPDVVDTELVTAAKSTKQSGDTANLFGKLLTPISSRLGRINPKLNTFIRKFEFAVNQNTKKSIDKVRPLMVGSSKMSADDRKLFSLARLNGDKEVYEALATKYNLTKELKAVEDAYEDIITRGNEVGMDIPRRENYHARVVKNPKAYLNYWRGQEDWGDINRLIQAEAEKKGIKYGDLMKDQEKVVAIINNYVRGYGNKTVLASPSFSKQRTLAVLDEELADFYEDADSALTTYMIRMNDEIEGRRFFGKKADGDADISDSIGNYVMELVAKGEIKPQQQEEVGDILRARFHRGKMHGALDVYRNAEYISTMGSPISAITQIGDFAWSLYDNGFWNTAKSVVGKKKLTRDELGLDASIMNEFTRDTWSGRAVDRVFKAVGLDKLARLGQETFVNANLAKLQNQALKNDDVLRTQVERVFDADEVDQVLGDLAQGNITEDTKFLAFSRLLDFQPLTKSEMPQTYLENPNGRMFYMLKSFTLKQYDIYRRESFDLIASGDKTKMKQGAKNLMALATLFMAANATADEIKDILLDRDTPPSDRIVDNLWRLAGASKYDVYKAREEGIGTTLLKKILFPASILDRATKDFETIVTDKEYEKGPLAGENYKFESTQTIPVGGKLYYWWFGRGDQKQEYKESINSSTNTSSVPSLPELPQLPKLPKLPKI